MPIHSKAKIITINRDPDRRLSTLTSDGGVRARLTIHNLLLGFILLLAFALRLTGLADRSIWWDEGIGVWLARMPVLESIRWTAGDVHPPLYYVLLRGWWLLVGAFPEGSEFVLRFPSVMFSFLAVPLIYRLGKVLAQRRKYTKFVGANN